MFNSYIKGGILMDKEKAVNIDKSSWILLCLVIGAILGIVAWNMKLF